MKFSQETLMAYADGELDADTRRAIESAMADDPEIGQQVARHRALRSELSTAFGSTLDEPVPTRLLDTAQNFPAGAVGNVADLGTRRAAKTQHQEPSRARRNWSWPEWTSIAASLLIGLLAGRSMLQSPGSNIVIAKQGQIVADGALAAALSNQTGGAGSGASGVNIGLSFRSKAGDYCRAFTSRAEGNLAGLACREADEWRVHALTQSDTESTGAYRMAGTELPPLVLQAVEDTIAGDALDADEEAAARARGWKQ